jgi:hypothetical protein
MAIIESSFNSDKKRCQYNNCTNKLDLIPFTCRCGLVTCVKHKFYKDHNCTYDYVKMNKEKLEKDNPLVIKDKINKI